MENSIQKKFRINRLRIDNILHVLQYLVILNYRRDTINSKDMVKSTFPHKTNFQFYLDVYFQID